MKIALLISGYLRTIKYNIQNIKQNIIQNHDCDIYIHITVDSEKDKYYNHKNNINIEKILQPKILIKSNNLNFCDDQKKNNIFNQNYKFFILNQQKKNIELHENIKYDLVIKFRPDLYIENKIEYVLSNNIIIPQSSKMDINKLDKKKNKYICDIFAYGNSSIMDKYFNIFLNLEYLIKKYGKINETLVYHYLNEYNIPYTLKKIEYIVILSTCNTIAICGNSSTGKTVLSNKIKKILKNSFILECDRYHKWERKNILWEKYTHLNPNANFLTKMKNDVFDLKLGRNIYQIDYDHNNGKFTDQKLIKSNENIIVCGLHALYNNTNLHNLNIFLDVDDNLRIPWKIKRDINKRGYSYTKILEQINKRKDDYINYILPQKEKSNIIINFYTDQKFDIKNIDNYNPPIYMKLYIKKFLLNNNYISILSKYKYTIKNIKNMHLLTFEKYNDYYEIILNIIKMFI